MKPIDSENINFIRSLVRQNLYLKPKTELDFAPLSVDLFLGEGRKIACTCYICERLYSVRVLVYYICMHS